MCREWACPLPSPAVVKKNPVHGTSLLSQLSMQLRMLDYLQQRSNHGIGMWPGECWACICNNTCHWGLTTVYPDDTALDPIVSGDSAWYKARPAEADCTRFTSLDRCRNNVTWVTVELRASC